MRPGPVDLSADGTGKAERLYADVISARLSKDRDKIVELVETHGLLSYPGRNFASSALYNLILLSLAEFHPEATPITAVIDFYNMMLAADHMPDTLAYRAVLNSLLQRDAEVLQSLSAAQERAMRFEVGLASGHNIQEYKGGVLSERNYESAVTLFEAGLNLTENPFTSAILSRMLVACAARGDVDNALRVFSHLRRSFGPFEGSCYASLVKAHRVAGNLEGCKKVFADYMRHCDTSGDSRTRPVQPNIDSDMPHEVRNRPQSSADVFEEMITAYIHFGHPDLAMELLESMIDKGVAGGRIPSFTTCAAIVCAFCDVVDVESALLWYGKLDHRSSNSQASYAVWRDVFYALAKSGAIHLFNHHVKSISCSTYLDALDPADIIGWLHWNGREMAKLLPADQKEVLLFVVNNLDQLVPESDALSSVEERDVIVQLRQLCNRAIGVHPATAVFFLRAMAGRCLAAESPMVHPNWTSWWSEYASNLASYVVSSSAVSRDTALRCVLNVCRVWMMIPELDHPEFMRTLCSIYAQVSKDAVASLNSADWRLLLDSFCQAEQLSLKHSRIRPDLSRLANDLTQIVTVDVDPPSLARLVTVLRQSRGCEVPATLLSAYLSVCGSSPSLMSTDFETQSPSGPDVAALNAQIDINHSKLVDQHSSLQRTPPNPTPQVCFERYRNGAAIGVFPSPEVTGRLINALGRLREVEKVQECYSDFQWVLASLQDDKLAQSSAWFTVEDQMIAALAHSGSLDAANTHRLRILHQGGAPRADSYGALIAAVKSTTDDSSLAQELFEEAERLDVVPNSYLYNTVISKMAKARKTEYALELFHRMPYLGLRPTAVTYAAVIGACCRVGDGESAVFLFDEMLSLPNYRPRVPVYNNMIQFFVSQRKDRDRALHYYRLLLDAGLEPSEHTFKVRALNRNPSLYPHSSFQMKLLLDAYGSIEPMDVAMLVCTFSEASAAFTPHGPLWASMINAWGCVGHDIKQATALFDACKQSSPSTLPDALVYEAMFNALFANDRLDLVSSYLEHMTATGVHMTAYIANVLIRGYSAAGDIQRAREVFDTLADPPLGVAAPHNHFIPLGRRLVSPNTPVFREVCSNFFLAGDDS